MRRVVIVLLIAILAVSTGNVFAQDTKGNGANAEGIALDVVTSIPRTMSYQGILKDGDGNPVGDGNYSITFRIYDAATDGNLLWMEGVTVTTVGGIFTAELGNTMSLDLPFDTDYYLSLQVLGDIEMPDLQRITMSAYSARTDTSDYAETAGIALAVSDNTVNSTSIIDGSINFEDIGQKKLLKGK